jgi:putative DNA primase/helicase
MSDDTSLTDPAAIRDQVRAAVAVEEAHRPVDPEPVDGPRDETELAPDITIADVEDAFRWKNVGDGFLAIKLLKGKICYDAVAEKPYRFNCTHWLRDKNANWRKALFEVADLYAIRAAHYIEQARELEGGDKEEAKRAVKRAEAWIKRVNSCRDVSYVRKIWEAATSGDGSLGISGDEWNQHPTLLPCKNTVVDLEKGKPIKPDAFQYFNKAATAPFNNLHDEAPFWIETLHKALGRDPFLIDYFEHLVGFAATGIQTKDFFCAYGPKGDNAKSVIFEWLLKILGDFAGTIKVEMLLEEKFMRSADGPSPAMLKLRGLRMAVTSEAAQNHRFAMNKIKSICAGGDRMEARGINAVDIVEFVPEVSLILHSNFLPQASGSDEAFYKRLKVLPFRSKFINPKDGPEDPEAHIYHAMARTKVDAILTKESPGIMAWVVRCAVKALAAGDMPPAPPCVLAETNQYRADQDLVGHFLRECTEPDKDNKEQMKDIYFAFRKWCSEEQMIPDKKIWSQNALGKDFKQRAGLEKFESNKTYYKGLRIKPEWRPNMNDDSDQVRF